MSIRVTNKYVSNAQNLKDNSIACRIGSVVYEIQHVLDVIIQRPQTSSNPDLFQGYSIVCLRKLDLSCIISALVLFERVIQLKLELAETDSDEMHIPQYLEQAVINHVVWNFAFGFKKMKTKGWVSKIHGMFPS